jgi:hypothetical protein
MLHWMSFAGEDGFLGVVLIEGDDLADATIKTHKMRINPGGSIKAAEISADKEFLIPEEFRNRLLTRTEVDRLVRHMRTLTTVNMSREPLH